MDDTTREPNEPAEDRIADSENDARRLTWTKPVLVPLSIALTEMNPGVGSDGGFFDSSHV